MIRQAVQALAACLVTFALCAVAYPAAVWGVGRVAFPDQAAGSLIYSRDRAVIGSSLVAQPFASEKYFHPRPSAVDYNASATGGSNLGTKNPDLRKKVAERAEALKATPEAPAPVDLVTASGGGLDPHISPEGASYQAARVAAARGLPVGQVRELIARHTDRSAAILGAPPRVNVLQLNLDLDEQKPNSAQAPAPTPAAAARPAPEAAGPAPSAGPPATDRPAAGAEALAERLDRIQARLDAAPVDRLADELKDVKVRLAGLAEASPSRADLARKLEEAGGRLAASDREVEALRSEVKALRESGPDRVAVAGLEGKLAALRADLDALRKPAPPAPAADPLEAGRSLFRAGKYDAAADAFRAACDARPDDARAWYFAGLARALATRQWRGEPERLAARGVEREKAGTPPAAEIDGAFSGLTPDTGRDWLAYFRRRAAQP